MRRAVNARVRHRRLNDAEGGEKGTGIHLLRHPRHLNAVIVAIEADRLDSINPPGPTRRSPKHVVVRQGSCESDADGIRVVSARDFFLGA